MAPFTPSAPAFANPPAWTRPPPLGTVPTPTVPESAEIKVGENGFIHGVDGMLHQVADVVMQHAGPMLVRDVLPAVRADKELQERVGTAVGEEVARQVQPWLAIGAGALGLLALLSLNDWYQSQQRPRSRSPRSRSRRR